MVNFWLNIMLHNCLAFKLRNGFLLPLTTLLFPTRVREEEEEGEK